MRKLTIYFAVGLLLTQVFAAAKTKITRNKKGGYSVKHPAAWQPMLSEDSLYLQGENGGTIQISVSPMYAPIGACEQLNQIEALYEGKRKNTLGEGERESPPRVLKAVGIQDGCHAHYDVTDDAGTRGIEFAVFADAKKKKIYQVSLEYDAGLGEQAKNELIDTMRSFTLK